MTDVECSAPASPHRSAATTTFYNHNCTKCQQVVREGVEYRASIYHRECLVCSHCNSQGAGSQFTNINSQPCCLQCYQHNYAHKCQACHSPINGIGDGFLVFMEGRRWHIDCFRCLTCEIPLLGEATFNAERGALCQNCINEE